MKRTLYTLLLATLLPAATAWAPTPEPPAERPAPAVRSSAPAATSSAPSTRTAPRNRKHSGTQNGVPVAVGKQTDKADATQRDFPPADTLRADWKNGLAAGITQPAFEGGGFDDFRRWVEERVPKDPTVLGHPIGARAIISFVIDTLGRLTDIRVLQSPDRTLTDGAVRVLNTSPRWEPGRQGARKVAVRYVLPVDFRQ